MEGATLSQSHNLLWNGALLLASGGVGYGSYFLLGRVCKSANETLNSVMGAQAGIILFFGGKLLSRSDSSGRMAQIYDEVQKLGQQLEKLPPLPSGDLSGEIKEISQNVNNKEIELSALKTNIETVQKSIQWYKENTPKLKEELEQKIKERDQLSARLEELKNELESKSKQYTDELVPELERLKKEYEVQDRPIIEVSLEVSQTKNQISNKKLFIQGKDIDINKINQSISEYPNKFQSLEEDRKNQSELLDQKKKELEELKLVGERKEKELEEVTAQLAEEQGKVKSKEDEIRTLQKSNRELESNELTVKNKISAAKRQVQEIEKQLTLVGKEIERKQNQLLREQENEKSLSTKIQQADETFADLSNQLDNAKKRSLLQGGRA